MQDTAIKEELTFITKPYVTLMAHTPEPEKVITAAAKLCYSNTPPSRLFENQTEESVEKFLNMIMAVGHGSILEHVVFTFAIEDISRVTEIQLCRHRTGSPSIQSGRYVRRNPAYFLPQEIAYDSVAMDIYLNQCENSTNAYLELIDRLEHVHVSKNLNIKVEDSYTLSSDDRSKELYEKERKKVEKIALEDARYVLPQSLRTHAVFSMDLRNLIHFIEKRKCKRAQSEIRMVAQQIYDEIAPVLPNIIKYIGAPCETGSCPEGNMSCKKPYKKEDK